MIPTMLLAGLVGGLFGRGSRWLLIPMVMLWPVLLVATGAGAGPVVWLGGIALAAANMTVGYLLGSGLRRLGLRLTSLRAPHSA